MGVALIHVVLFLNLFEMEVGNPIHLYKYRFDVYPVERCPMNVTEFEEAARRRKCSGKSRYLCAPDKYLSNLIEFCTDRKLSLFKNGNCVRLEGTGDLNHFRCAERFKSGCPTKPYTDEELYKNPACLLINTKSNCFVADHDCQTRHDIYVYNTKAEDTNENASKVFHKPSNLSLAIFIVYIVLIVTSGTCFMNHLLKKERAKRKYKYFWNRHQVYSHWHRCIFVIGGKTYHCVEQYIMHQKAELMNDFDAAETIMKLDEPKEIKELGRKVKNFNDQLWVDKREGIVEKGNMAKFEQNIALKQKLLSTYPKILVESCPEDNIWGIGLSKDDERAWNESTWQGQNLLGKILVRVREKLMDTSK